MRRFLALSYWQRPLMHFDPTKRPSSSPNNPRVPLTGTKRPFSQQAVALPDTSSSKAPRIDFSQRSPRPNPNLLPYTPSQQGSAMSSSRGHSTRPKGGTGFGYKTKTVPGHGPSFSKSQRKKVQRRLPRFEEPLHDEDYIVREHKKSLLPLKPLHEAMPKSSLGNFSMAVAGKTPSYTFSEGQMVLNSGPTNIWRYVPLRVLFNMLLI